jgi:hypothetical protein
LFSAGSGEIHQFNVTNFEFILSFNGKCSMFSILGPSSGIAPIEIVNGFLFGGKAENKIYQWNLSSPDPISVFEGTQPAMQT